MTISMRTEFLIEMCRCVWNHDGYFADERQVLNGSIYYLKDTNKIKILNLLCITYFLLNIISKLCLAI